MTQIYEDFVEENAEKERKWEYVAEQKGYLCERCKKPPMFEERDIYFDTGYCGYCAHHAEKLEKE